MIRARAIVLFSSLLLALPLQARGQEAGSSPATAPDAISIDAFGQELDRLIAVLDITATPAAAAHLASTIPERWRIQTRTDTVDVSARWLTSSLLEAEKRADWKSTRADIRRRIVAVRDETRELAIVDSLQARRDARGAIAGILARAEFQESAASRWRDRTRTATWSCSSSVPGSRRAHSSRSDSADHRGRP